MVAVPSPLDEYPIHQAPLSMRHVVSGDRNVYDRCYFNAHGGEGDPFLVTGLGVYPNLGVIDAFATVRVGRRQVSVHASDALTDDRMSQAVGPFRIDVLEPLQRLRLRCTGDGLGVGFDLTWESPFPPVEEQPHLIRSGGRTIIEAQRFAQVGCWSGELSIEGRSVVVEPEHWVGTRDRSWGTRAVGEPEPPGRATAETPPDFGFWWVYAPLAFEDFSVIVIVQEDGRGHRTYADATRVWPRRDGRPPEPLGWPEVDIRYRPGTRLADGATIRLRTPERTTLEVEVATLGWVALNAGAGYFDPDWTHGSWRGRDHVESVVHDLGDPAVAGRVTFGAVDYVARATCAGQEGWGLFEHVTIGRHDPSGFADFGSTA